ncbi:MAG: zinc-ribbon domain-containing protein [Gemmatimonadetes bacterium]|nr:zinc-ribbon domain-containing protein [Gemmatimonadota bacterium]
MNATCPGCDTVFRIDPAKVPAGGVRARCSVCATVFAVGAPAAIARPEAVAVLAPPPVASEAAPSPAPAAPLPVAPPVAPPVPVAPPRRPAAPVASPFAGARGVAPAAPAGTPPSARPPLAVRPAVAPRSPRPAPTVPVPQPPPEPAAPAPPPAARVINPFLVQDPQVKARRLARALISDLVSYHPAKRAQGLKDGTIKEIFAEEIKKSYEEYVGQIGPETAQSTTHFQDALNEILAGGQKIF